LVGIACYTTAVDFRARLRFPWGAGEPAGVFALPSNQQLEASYLYKTYVHSTNEKIRTSLILHQESRFIVRIFLQLKYVCPSLF
ncbi:hypothetical protein MOF27_10355, partial [Priestia megaterium]|uniref:hypothetical protein n=1 Tax=Priestia megaterium TaxID=1404 RepID=UPI00227E5570